MALVVLWGRDGIFVVDYLKKGATLKAMYYNTLHFSTN
jgi:hypothetical protein